MCTERCLIPPSPQLRARIDRELAEIREQTELIGPMVRVIQPKRPGLNDGLILPGNYFPIGTPLERVRSEAAERAPLRGPVRIVVVLAEFDDCPLEPEHNKAYYERLFFSRGELPDGSVREYYAEVSHGMIDIVGEVIGPYRPKLSLRSYANGESGVGSAEPNARTMARHIAELANVDFDFSTYDNDGNGFVDAYIVIHAGGGAEETGSAHDIWSHKWVLPGGEYNADGVRIYAYLTVPEDARIGVCCHELGHLLFGWPDLYDTDSSSEGLGNWCLMAGGSWNGMGDLPAHPSAWCKAEQAWVTVVNHTSAATLSIPDVKDSHTVHRLWKHGVQGNEYFLLENRQRRNFDRGLPGDGMLVYHVDNAVSTNADERHPKVGLLQADGAEHLNTAANRGDPGDPFPGTSRNRTINATSRPNTRAYGGLATEVSITDISDSASVMTARIAVRSKVVVKKRRMSFWDLFRAPQPIQAALLEQFSGNPVVAERIMQELQQPQGQLPFTSGGFPWTSAYGFGNLLAHNRFDPTFVEWARATEQRLTQIENLLSLLRPEVEEVMVGEGTEPFDPNERT